MTKQETNALATLRYNVTKLTELVAEQTELLQRQAYKIELLKEERNRLARELEESQKQGQMAKIAQGLSGDNFDQEKALSFLEDIIEEIQQCLRLLEQE